MKERKTEIKKENKTDMNQDTEITTKRERHKQIQKYVNSKERQKYAHK